MKKILLDTNAYSAYLSGDQKIFLALAQADSVLISVIVLGELFAGFRGGSQFTKNNEILQKFLAKPTVEISPVSEETSEIFGEIKNVLRKNGTPLPINDIWISSQAVETGSVIVTFDDHFKKVPGLRLWDSL